MHRKIRLIKGNAKCRHLKKLTCTGTFRQLFICLRPINGCPYAGNIFTIKTALQCTLKTMIAAFSCSLSKKKCFSSALIFMFFRFERKIKKYTVQRSNLGTFLKTSLGTFTSGPLSGPLCPRSAPRLPPRTLPRIGPPPLWLLFWGPDPRPRWDGRAASAAGRVWAATQVAAQPPRLSSWRAQRSARWILAAFSCLPARPPPLPWPGPPSVSLRRPCWRWMSDGLRRKPRCSLHPQLSGPEAGTRRNRRN